MWSLVLMVILVNGPVATTSVTGFLDQISCEKAGKQVQQTWKDELIMYQCVQVYK
jgi:hypothetical protein